MSTRITMELKDSAKAVLAKFERLPKEIVAAVAAALWKQNIETTSHIQRTYLSAPKQGPTGLDYLRSVGTPGLRGSMQAPQPTITGQEINSAIGTNINAKGFSYPTLHEFGGSWTRTVKAGDVRLRATAKGELQRNSFGGAIFAKKKHTRVLVVPISEKKIGKSYSTTMPARGLIQRGISDLKAEYSERISAAIVGAFQLRGAS